MSPTHHEAFHFSFLRLSMTAERDLLASKYQLYSLLSIFTYTCPLQYIV